MVKAGKEHRTSARKINDGICYNYTFIWRTFAQVAGLETDVHAKRGWVNGRENFMSEEKCFVGQRMLRCSREAIHPAGLVLSLRGCRCYSMFKALLEIIHNEFLISKIPKSKIGITGWTIKWKIDYFFFLFAQNKFSLAAVFLVLWKDRFDEFENHFVSPVWDNLNKKYEWWWWAKNIQDSYGPEEELY